MNTETGEILYLTKVYESRPFKTRNADEFDLSSLLYLFVDPTDGMRTPFDYENMIVKGKMGSGKTMFLRANLACYLYSFVTCLMEEKQRLENVGKIAARDAMHPFFIIFEPFYFSLQYTGERRWCDG